MDRTWNYILREGIGVQNLLTELEERRLQWFGHVTDKGDEKGIAFKI
jgi:hypothetical protein